MYVDKGAMTVYSLNLDMHSIRNDNLEIENDYWGIGLSSIIKGKNEYGIHYQKKEKILFLIKIIISVQILCIRYKLVPFLATKLLKK